MRGGAHEKHISITPDHSVPAERYSEGHRISRRAFCESDGDCLLIKRLGGMEDQILVWR